MVWNMGQCLTTNFESFYFVVVHYRKRKMLQQGDFCVFMKILSVYRDWIIWDICSKGENYVQGKS